MWVKLSPKDWERIGKALRDTCWLWREFQEGGKECRGDKAKELGYRSIYRKFLTAPIVKGSPMKKPTFEKILEKEIARLSESIEILIEARNHRTRGDAEAKTEARLISQNISVEQNRRTVLKKALKAYQGMKGKNQ